MTKKEDKRNYLEFVPVHRPGLEFHTDSKGKVVLKKEWTGFYHRIAQKLFHRPRVSQIHLDAYGTFVWNTIDGGQRNVFEISKEMEKQYPNMEKGMARLIQFLEVLHDHQFIVWKQKL